MSLGVLLGMVATTAVLGSAARDGERQKQRVLASLVASNGNKVGGPLLSVIIPTYNEESYLSLCLTSLANQSYQDIEVVVVDSSTDSTPEIARQCGCIVVGSPFGNVSRARNEGTRTASGEILLFLDADCMMAVDTIERLVNALEEGYVLAWGGNYAYEDGDYSLFRTLATRFRRPWHTTGRGIAIWRWAFDEVGGYDELCNPLEGCREDIDLGKRIRGCFGRDSIAYLIDAAVGTSMRREKVYGFRMWEVPAVR